MKIQQKLMRTENLITYILNSY